MSVNATMETHFGRYRLLEQIGRGGTASVFRAYDKEDDTYVAIKVLSSGLAIDDRFEKRFAREAKVLTEFDHPHIVPVIDYGEAGGFAYLVMPLLQVGSLAERMDRGALSLAAGASIFDQIADALAYAHARNVIHRDVKPSNILLDKEGQAMLSDFGLAQIEDVSISLTGSAVVGTPAYMAPEQARGEPSDARSDQYSLGVILYQMATRKLPYKAETPMAMLVKQMNDPLPLPSSVNPNIPETFEAVILKATAKDPGDRFETMAEFRDVFDSAVAHSISPGSNPAPVIVVPPSAIDSSASLRAALDDAEDTRRRRLRIGAIVGALLLLLLACPVVASFFNIGGDDTPAAPMIVAAEDLNEGQLTALAGTVQAMSTELAGAGGTPVPTEMLQEIMLATLSAGDEFGELVLIVPTNTLLPGAPTATDNPLIPTNTPSFGASNTPAPGATNTLPPGATNTPLPGATDTLPPPPTSTPTSTNTPTASPTVTNTPSNTPVPPTATTDVCSLLSLSGPSTDNDEATWVISNAGADTRITGIELSWSAGNGNLERIQLRNNQIWNGDASSPANITSGWELGPGKRNVVGGDNDLIFRFNNNAAGSGYNLTVTMQNGCDVED